MQFGSAPVVGALSFARPAGHRLGGGSPLVSRLWMRRYRRADGRVQPSRMRQLRQTCRLSAPTAAPCSRRFSDCPCRIEGTCMVFPFARQVSERRHGHPYGFPVQHACPYSAPSTVAAMRRLLRASSSYFSCHSVGPFEGVTWTAVTLYSGQLVAQSEYSVVTTLACVFG